MWREVFNDKKEIPFFLEADDCTEEVDFEIEPEKVVARKLTEKELEEKLSW